MKDFLCGSREIVNGLLDIRLHNNNLDVSSSKTAKSHSLLKALTFDFKV